MIHVTLSLPEETALALKVTPEQLGGEMHPAAAVKLYGFGKLSTCKGCRSDQVFNLGARAYLQILLEYILYQLFPSPLRSW